MITRNYGSVPLLHFNNLDSFSDVFHFVTTRRGGVSSGAWESFNLGFNSGDDHQNVENNRKILADAVGVNLDCLIFQKQIHSDIVTVVDKPYHGSEICETDSMITNKPGLCLCVKGADCVPILFFDPVGKAVGVAHAGWKGTVKKIAANVIEAMELLYSCKPSDIKVAVGPSIGPEVYEVGAEVIEKARESFGSQNPFIIRKNDKTYFDLWEANRSVLIEAGVLSKNIEISGICNYSNDNDFFSHRKSGGKTGRFAAGIMIK